MHAVEDEAETETNTNSLKVNPTLPIIKVLWIKSFIVFVLTSVHQVKGEETQTTKVLNGSGKEILNLSGLSVEEVACQLRFLLDNTQLMH